MSNDLNLPWSRGTKWAEGCVIKDSNGKPLGSPMTPFLAPEIAAHIVRCVNAHDGLVGALQSVIAAVEACEGTWDDNDFPLHAHEKSGIWDDDNSNDQSGQPCVECAQWKAAKAALAAATKEKP